VKLRFVVLA